MELSDKDMIERWKNMSKILKRIKPNENNSQQVDPDKDAYKKCFC